jgi:MEDS: MEthanogen/methylotroph, DcmR Sensory domain
VSGWPDAAGFWRTISPLIRQASEHGQPVHVFGEMVSVLWDSGLVDAAIEVEAMWNELGSQYPFALLCGYPAGSVGGEQHHDALTEVCRLHAAAVGGPAG